MVAPLFDLSGKVAVLYSKRTLLLHCGRKMARINQLDHITLQRFGEPEELRGVMVFLSSRAASYMTGQALIIDGGQVMVR